MGNSDKFFVTSISVENRAMNGDRLQGAVVSVGSNNCDNMPASTLAGRWYTSYCGINGRGIQGDSVSISVTTSGYDLSICGIRVFVFDFSPVSVGYVASNLL